jgi:hypothetical protein
MRVRAAIQGLGVAWAASLQALAGCSGDLGDDASGGAGAPATASVGSGGGAAEGGGSGAGGDFQGFPDVRLDEPPCPPDMVLVDAFCMDRFEAPNVEGAEPLVMQSALTADAWCAEQGKRLCTEHEWDAACQGPDLSTYPYGDAYQPGACNDDKTWIAPDEQVLATWPSQEAQDEVERLYQAAPSGSYSGCASAYGVFDLTGNVEEWVVRTKYHVNEYPHVLKGCYWSGCYGGSKPTCLSTNPAHASAFKFYETGFRCCSDVD